jgi:hypothetical protein
VFSASTTDEFIRETQQNRDAAAAKPNIDAWLPVDEDTHNDKRDQHHRECGAKAKSGHV